MLTLNLNFTKSTSTISLLSPPGELFLSITYAKVAAGYCRGQVFYKFGLSKREA